MQKVGAGQVRVLIRASGVNPADTKRRAGWVGVGMMDDLIIPHADGAGIIDAIGDGVTHLKKGDRVWLRNAQGGYGEAGRAFGTAAEQIVLPAKQVFALPDALTFAQGACLGIPALTAYDAVYGDGPVKGQRVLIQGVAGAVGHFAAQFALAGGAQVIGTVSSQTKADHAQAIGVHSIIDRHQGDVAEKILSATDGAGVDRLIEVDFGGNLDVTKQVLAPHAVIASYSSTRVPEPLLPYYIFAILGATLHFVQGFLLKPDILKAAVGCIRQMAEQGHLQVAVAQQFALEDIVLAHQMVESGQAIGNVVVALDTK